MYKFDDLAEKMFSGDLRGARTGLISHLNSYSDLYQKKIIKGKQFFPPRFVVMLDGKKDHGLDIQHETVGFAEIYYSMDLSADHLIKKYVHSHPHPKSITAVSSDKGVLKSIRSLTGRLLTSEEFHKLYNEALSQKNECEDQPGEEKEILLDEKELNYWQKLFSGKKETQ